METRRCGAGMSREGAQTMKRFEDLSPMQQEWVVEVNEMTARYVANTCEAIIKGYANDKQVAELEAAIAQRRQYQEQYKNKGAK